jgi:Fe-S-cluster containining protein
MPECLCSTCAGACTRYPGRFAPGEVATVSAYLAMTPQQLFDDYLAIVGTMEPDVCALAPAVVGHAGASETPRARGRCVCLTDEGKCAIHAVKPLECVQHMHSDSVRTEMRRHFTILDAWCDHQDEVAALHPLPDFRLPHARWLIRMFRRWCGAPVLP